MWSFDCFELDVWSFDCLDPELDPFFFKFSIGRGRKCAAAPFPARLRSDSLDLARSTRCKR